MGQVDNMVKTTVEEIDKMLSARTVLGQPVTVEGATLIPVISVGFWFGAGGGATKEEAKRGGGGMGGTGGAAGMKPIAMVIIDKEGVRIEPIKGGLASAVEKLGEMIPRMMEKMRERRKERMAEREKEE